jgi:hypothetical protein
MKALVKISFIFVLLCAGLLQSKQAYAQDAAVSVTPDANKIMVGDQLRLFIEAKHNNKQSRLQWAAIPDTFNKLEIVERGKIDTITNGDIVTYKQRVLVTGFDSGMFVVPQFTFPVIPNGGTAYTIQTDSFQLLVQTVAVDTTQPYKGIKGIMTVQSSWMDYIWFIIGGLLFIGLAIFVFFYFIKNKKVAALPPPPSAPVETLQQQALNMLTKLEQRQLWQNGRIKEYYSELTDILRSYIEARFDVPTLELTTDEMLANARKHKDLNRHVELLGSILYTADLAKFAKAEPLPHEHTDAMENARKFVNATPSPVTTETPKQ